MPHMSPIMWSVIMIMSFLLIILLLTMIYFNICLEAPSTEKKGQETPINKWAW
uniref:ATP synthase F0 subunit 8 n=1 Tax=Eochionelasmus ohtai TaxID=1290545 RepID=A0A343SWF0_9CRUS|nr:ATP synthase F0 subunit 8 [Eochionelasmus ohtai]AUT77224.1 ATP synthase F0 subunit 8 [Eochionelasmus ohtai]